MKPKTQQFTLDLPLRAAYGREDFLIAPSNEQAVAWIDSWPDWPAPAFILYGEAASGKTHLSYVWQERSEAVRIPASDLAAGDFSSLIARNRAVIIEDVDQVIGERESETALFHLYNMAKEEQASLFLTATQAPVNWQFVVADLKSRLCSVPSVAIFPPDDQLLKAVLVKLFHDRQIVVGDDVIAYILARMERSFKAARRLADLADRQALEEKRGVTVPLIRAVMDRMDRENQSELGF